VATPLNFSDFKFSLFPTIKSYNKLGGKPEAVGAI